MGCCKLILSTSLLAEECSEVASSKRRSGSYSVPAELLASMLFTEVLGDREVLVVVRLEQFSKYEGYADC